MSTQTAKVEIKKAVIAEVAEGKSVPEICGILSISPIAIEKWKAKDTEFRTKYREAEENAVLSARGELLGALPEAVKRIVATVEAKDLITEGVSEVTDTKPLTYRELMKARNLNGLSYQAANDMVKGLGVYQAGPVVEVNNDNRKVVLVIEREGQVVKEVGIEIGKHN